MIYYISITLKEIMQMHLLEMVEIMENKWKAQQTFRT